jgi:hypothetical protein
MLKEARPFLWKHRAMLASVGAIFFLLMIAWGATSSGSYKDCQTSHETNYVNYDNPDFYEKAATFFECEGVTIDANNGTLSALATLLLALITYWLFELSREQGNTDRAQLRAYVMVAATADTRIISGAIPQVKIRIKNFGQTPAHNVKVATHTQFTEFPFADEFEFADPAAQFGRPLGPQDDFSLLVTWDGCTVTPEKIGALVDNRWALRMNAKVTYEDIFDKQHETRFAVFCNGQTGMTVEAPNNGRWGAIDVLNLCT